MKKVSFVWVVLVGFLCTTVGFAGDKATKVADLKTKKTHKLSGKVKSAPFSSMLRELEKVVPPKTYFVFLCKSTEKDGKKQEWIATLPAKKGGYQFLAFATVSMDVGDTAYLRDGNLEINDYSTPVIEERLAQSTMKSMHHYKKMAIVHYEADESSEKGATWKAKVAVLKEPLTKKSTVRLMN